MPRCDRRATVRVLLAGAVLAVAACSPGPGGDASRAQGEAQEAWDPAPPSAGDALALLKRHFAAEPACGAFFAMPWDVSTDSAHNRGRAEALVQAGLLRAGGESRLPGAGGGQPAIRFVPTERGAATFRAPAAGEGGVPGLICYGTVVVEDATVTDADPMMRRAAIRYRYRLGDVPGWVREPAVAAIWPWLSERLAAPGEDNARLIWRDGEWRLDGTPRPGAFDLRDLTH
ncbi:hypothetical protein [uncultured Sphingomonas sp.]|uniref:hypothetical protein n=1 Tax=uncultured Sphingomonas sp. TaxID=158754 RepID=UPI002589BB23|nr:hypothetical protein [uncultured Sphingomonas sp.]